MNHLHNRLARLEEAAREIDATATGMLPAHSPARTMTVDAFLLLSREEQFGVVKATLPRIDSLSSAEREEYCRLPFAERVRLMRDDPTTSTTGAR